MLSLGFLLSFLTVLKPVLTILFQIIKMCWTISSLNEREQEYANLKKAPPFGRGLISLVDTKAWRCNFPMKFPMKFHRKYHNFIGKFIGSFLWNKDFIGNFLWRIWKLHFQAFVAWWGWFTNFFCNPLQTSPYSGFRLGMMYIEKKNHTSVYISARRPVYLLIIYHPPYN